MTGAASHRAFNTGFALATVLFGLATSCAPRPGQIVSAPSAGEARVFIGDLKLAEGESVLITRRVCKPGGKPMNQKCRSKQVGTGQVVRIEETSKGRHALVRVYPETVVHRSDWVQRERPPAM